MKNVHMDKLVKVTSGRKASTVASNEERRPKKQITDNAGANPVVRTGLPTINQLNRLTSTNRLAWEMYIDILLISHGCDL